nr:MAG TPA: hypothetical protein [Caudoviricetes sp.]
MPRRSATCLTPRYSVAIACPSCQITQHARAHSEHTCRYALGCDGQREADDSEHECDDSYLAVHDVPWNSWEWSRGSG